MGEGHSWWRELHEQRPSGWMESVSLRTCLAGLGVVWRPGVGNTLLEMREPDLSSHPGTCMYMHTHRKNACVFISVRTHISNHSHTYNMCM